MSQFISVGHQTVGFLRRDKLQLPNLNFKIHPFHCIRKNTLDNVCLNILSNIQGMET